MKTPYEILMESVRLHEREAAMIKQGTLIVAGKWSSQEDYREYQELLNIAEQVKRIARALPHNTVDYRTNHGRQNWITQASRGVEG